MKIFSLAASFAASLAIVFSCSASTQAGLFDLETKLTAADAVTGDWIGGSVALSGNTALAGAPHPLNVDGGSLSGSAYLYRNVPEPSTLLLGTLACMGLFFRRNR